MSSVLNIIERALIEAVAAPGQSKLAREQARARRDFGQLVLRYYSDVNGDPAETGNLATVSSGMAYALAILFLASPPENHSTLAALIFAEAEQHSQSLGKIFGAPWLAPKSPAKRAEAKS